MKTVGNVWFIYPEQVVTDKFKKREFILEIAENPQYPQYVKFECIQDKCDLLNNFQQGQTVDIEFNLNGRMYEKDGENRAYNTLQCWKMAASQ